jgi:trigger factor
MKYEIKHLPKSLVQITVTLSEEYINSHRHKACEELAQEVKIKGFRTGHIPPHVLENHLGKDTIDAHVKELAVKRSYADAVVKEKVQVVARPEIKVEKEEPFTYTATVAIMPEVKLKDYKSIKIKKEEQKATEKDIEDAIEEMKRYATKYKDVEREAKKGDRVEVDFEGFDKDDKAVPSTKSTNHPVILGEGSLVEGFEDELIGLKKDGKKEFEITFPKDYRKKDFQGKKIKFKVHVKRIEEPIYPEIDETFVERMTGKRSPVNEFKEELKKTIQAQKEAEEKKKQENTYIENLLKKMEVEIPDSLIEEEAYHILHEMKEEIKMKGWQFEKFLEQTKMKEEDLLTKYKTEAERRLRIRLAIQEVIKLEGIVITDEEIADELKKIKSLYPKEEDKKIQEEFDKGDLKNTLANRLILNKFFDKVLA